MADPRFFTNVGPVRLGDLAGALGLSFVDPAHADVTVADVAPLDAAGPSAAAFCSGARHHGALRATAAGVVLLREADAGAAPSGCVPVLAAQPQRAFAALARRLYPAATGYRVPTAGFAVHPSAQLAEGVVLEAGVVIGEGAEIGPRTVIGAGAVIGRGVAVGADAVIGAGATIGCALLGDRVVIHAGARIGQDGFGYVRGPAGMEAIPQLGRVILQDDVEVGANTCIDRGALSDTVIGEGTKVDNLVQIGHNCRIGRGCILAAQVGMSGSVTLGDFVVLGGQVGVADHVTIGTGAMVAGRSGVTRSLPGGGVYGGFPARPVAEWRREVATLARLSKRRGGQAKEGATQADDDG